MSQEIKTPVSAQGFEYGVKHFYNKKSGPITEILFDSLNLTSEDSANLLKFGAIYINNIRQLKDTNITENNLFRVHTKPRRYNCDYDWSSRIVYENQDFVIANKPSGLPSHPSVDNIIENSLSQIAKAKRQNLFITHRLDTLTSGLIVYAKNNSFVKNFNSQLQNRLIEKRYVALAETSQSLPARLLHYMEPTPRAPKKLSDIFIENWALCELEILNQKKLTSDLTWLKINLLTGRTHQIRSQLSYINAPILGDPLYGSKLSFQPDAIALRACELEFNWGTQRVQFKLNEDFDI